MKTGDIVKIKEVSPNTRFAKKVEEKLLLFDGYKVLDNSIIVAINELSGKKIAFDINDDCMFIGMITIWTSDIDVIKNNYFEEGKDYSYEYDSYLWPWPCEDPINGLIFLSENSNCKLNYKIFDYGFIYDHD